MKHALVGAPLAAALILAGAAQAQSPIPLTPPATQPAAPAAPANPPAQPPAAAAPASPPAAVSAPMTPAKPAPTTQAAAPATPLPKKQIVHRRALDYRDTEESADALNGAELRQSPIVATTTMTMTPVPAPAYYPPPPAPYYPPGPVPYYPPPWYWRPY
jgi:hypothetical protein